MVLVIEMNILAKFQEAQMKELLALTAKDQIYLITKEDDVLPVSMLPMLTKISAKLDIRTLSKNDSGFEKGFLYGSLSNSAGKEKVVILSSESAPLSIADNCTWNEGFGIKAKHKVLRSQKEAGTETAGQVTESPLPVKKGRNSTGKKTDDQADKKPAAGGLFSAPVLADCLDMISGKEETFEKCLADASDSEIGYKMLLGLNFGTDGDKIWEATHNQFKQLRKML